MSHSPTFRSINCQIGDSDASSNGEPHSVQTGIILDPVLSLGFDTLNDKRAVGTSRALTGLHKRGNMSPSRELEMISSGPIADPLSGAEVKTGWALRFCVGDELGYIVPDAFESGP